MTFSDLTAQIKKLPLEEVRSESAGLFECVFNTGSSEKLTALLESFFGPALKPSGQNPTRELEACSAAFGGVRKNQTLYYVEKAGIFHCAMIWPWSDETKATLKIFPAKSKISSSDGSSASSWGKISENIRRIFSSR